MACRSIKIKTLTEYLVGVVNFRNDQSARLLDVKYNSTTEPNTIWDKVSIQNVLETKVETIQQETQVNQIQSNHKTPPIYFAINNC